MKYRNLLLLLLLACLWGPSFMFIKLAVAHGSPLAISTLRILIGAAILLLIIQTRTGTFGRPPIAIGHFFVTGFFNMALPYSLISTGEQYIDSALAGILNGLTPFFTLLITWAWNKSEHITPNKVIGTLAGFAGLCFILTPQIQIGSRQSILGVLLVAGAAASYGFAAVYTKKRLTGLQPLVAPTWQLLASAALLMPLLITLGHPSQLLEAPSIFWLSVGFLGFFGTAMAYIVYFKIIEHADASFLTLVTYLMPVISVVLGIVFLDEHLTWYHLTGALLIVGGLFTMSHFQPSQK